MGKSNRMLGGFCWTMYFIFIMIPTILIILFIPLIFLSDTKTIIEAGFSSRQGKSMVTITGAAGLFIGISLLVKPLRGMYHKLPWLFPFVKIGYLNMIIVNMGTLILEFGYEKINSFRHVMFFILMVIQVLICRILMSVYLKFRSIEF